MPRALAVTLAALCVAAGAVAGAPAAGSAGAAQGSPGTLRVALVEPRSIDPATIADSSGVEVTRLLFDSLTDVTTASKVVPAAASSWTVSPDQRTFTFTLRPDATFSNGRAVTASDFAFTFARLADPDLASSSGGPAAIIEGFGAVQSAPASGVVGDQPVSGVRAVDDHTLEIRTTEPFAQLPALLADVVYSPVPAEAVSAERAAAFADEPVGNGPYAIDGPWVHDQHIDLRRRAGAAGGHGPARISFELYSDPTPAYGRLRTGALDVADVPLGRVDDARSRFGDTLVSGSVAAISYLGLPPTAPFDRPEVRRALSLAIDREAIATRIAEGLARPATGSVSTAVGGEADACAACRYAPARAKRLYERSGGLAGDRITLRYPEGPARDLVEAIANDWRRVLGVDTQLIGEERTELYRRAYTLDFDGAILVTFVATYASPLSFLASFESTSPDNQLRYANPEFDALVARARAASDPAAAKRAMRAAQGLVEDDFPAIPLFENERLVATSDRTSGVAVHPLGYLVLERARLGR